MKRTPSLAWLSAILILFSAGSLFCQGVQIEKAPPSGQTPAENSPAAPSQPPKAPRAASAAEALYDYLQKYHIEVAKDQVGPRFVWTDRIFIEVADGPPPEPLASLLSAAPGNRGEFVIWVQDTFGANIKAWHSAKKNPHPPKEGTDEFVSDAGDVRCFVNPVYVAYVFARYPKATILVKGPTDPALFTVDGQLRAIVSPWTKLPDGTPLL